jgi:hypothetical protein
LLIDPIPASAASAITTGASTSSAPGPIDPSQVDRPLSVAHENQRKWGYPSIVGATLVVVSCWAIIVEMSFRYGGQTHPN